MESKQFSKMCFDEQITYLHKLADKYNIIYAELVFKTILDSSKKGKTKSDTIVS